MFKKKKSLCLRKKSLSLKKKSLSLKKKSEIIILIKLKNLINKKLLYVLVN